MKNKEHTPHLSTLAEKLKMYFSPEVAKDFAEHEQNEKNFRVAEIVDRILMEETKGLPNPLQVAELGGGAHPDRYHEFFRKLLEEPRGHIDWVDISPHMLKLAPTYISGKDYEARKEIIAFVEKDIINYLRGLENESLDIAIMKYTIGHIEDLGELFELLSKKLKKGGKVISTAGNLNPELRSVSTNAQFLYNGEEFPEDETRTLKDGDLFTIKFFTVSGNPQAGFIEGGETVKFFHSKEKIVSLAKTFGLDIFIGDWKDHVAQENQNGEKMSQDVVVLTKK